MEKSRKSRGPGPGLGTSGMRRTREHKTGQHLKREKAATEEETEAEISPPKPATGRRSGRKAETGKASTGKAPKHTLQDYDKTSYTLKLVGNSLHGSVFTKDEQGVRTGATRRTFLSAAGASREEVTQLLEEAQRKRESADPIVNAKPRPPRIRSKARTKDDGLSHFMTS